MRVDYTLLGVEPEADEREIKRAYAIRLKRTRPDRDAQGYQRLREAFDGAIAIAQMRAAGKPKTAMDAGVSETESPNEEIAAEESAPDRWRVVSTESHEQNADSTTDGLATQESRDSTPAAEAEESFDFQQFVSALKDAAACGPAAFERWLTDHPSLYSIRLKERLGRPLVLHVATIEPALSAPALAILMHFFGVIQSGRFDPELAAAIATAQHRSLAATPGASAAEQSDPQTARPTGNLVYRELTTPPNRWRRIAILVLPFHRQRMRKMLARLHSGGRVPPPGRYRADALAYWNAALLPKRPGVPWIALSYIALAIAGAAFWFSTGSQRNGAGYVASAIVGVLALRYLARAPIRFSGIGFRIHWRWMWILFVLARLVYQLSHEPG